MKARRLRVWKLIANFVMMQQTVMKRLFFTLAALLLALPWRCAADGGRTAEYATPDNVSIEDVFFTRFMEQIYNADSTMKAKPTVLSGNIDEGLWNEKFKKLTLWGESEEDAVSTYNAAKTLFLKNPQVRYADIAERALYNGVLAEIDSSRFGKKTWEKAAQAVLDAPATAYAMRGSDLWVNLYFRNRAYIKNDSLDLVILQNTSAPWVSDVFFSLKFNNANPYMRLHLRLPAWLRGEVTPTGEYAYKPMREYYQVVLNGKRLTLRASADGYITIDRVWQSDDVIRLSMQTAVRRIRPAQNADNRFAVQEGPIVYVHESRGEKAYFDPDAAYGNKYDKDVLHTNMLTTKTYSSKKPDDDTPWGGVLLPYYIAYGRNQYKPQIWLEAVEK